jgi:cytoskeletal protein RodZ
MTRYSRSVIPGRSHEAGNPSDIDRLVFGRKSAANDRDEDIPDTEVSELVDRASNDRRKGSRRRSEFAPLPEEKNARRQPADSKRGPLLLIGAVVIVGIFGVVVWNAYRDGVRPEDSAVAPPIITPSGAFKSRPASADEAPVEQASVFEQVEGPKPVAGSTPEVRSAPAPQAVTPAPVKSAPVQTAAAPPKQAPATPSKPVQTAAATPAATAPANRTSTPPAPIKADAPVTLAPNPAESKPAAPKPATPELAGAFKPAFSQGGKFVVQIAAPSTEAAALGEWEKRAKASPELFSAAERLVVQADVNGRTVYRLRAGAFATGADADAFCAAYQAKGGACFKTTR